MKRFYINESDIQQLGLKGNVLLCYTALRALCSNPSQTWRGSIADLYKRSGTTSEDATDRAVDKLFEMHLICKVDKRYSIPQYTEENAEQIPQNGEKFAQNAGNKESTKEYNKLFNNSERENQRETHAPTLVFDKNKIFNPPYWNEWEAFGKKEKIPLMVYKKAWCFYMMRGWEGVREWKAALLYWDLKDKT